MIVGLGNPGEEFKNTRHNVGFMYIDIFAKLYNQQINKTKFNGEYTEIVSNGEKIILLKPLSYMNLSGEVVIKYVNYFKIEIDNLLIISDDLDMEIGKIKLKLKGSSGGHNGLKNIEQHLCTQEYKRLKIGISKSKNMSTKDYVLGKFSVEEQEKLKQNEEKIINILKDFSHTSFEVLMSRYNGT